MFFVISISLCLLAVANSSLWSFSPYGDIRPGPVPTDRKVTLTYKGAETIVWQVDDHYCSVENAADAVTSLTCRKPGTHRISLSVPSNSDVSTRYIKFLKNREGYSWVAKQYDTSTYEFQLWIEDLNEGSTSSAEMTERSQWVTKQFALAGQHPHIGVYGNGLYASATRASCLDFNTTAGYWLCSVDSSDNHGVHNLHVHGHVLPLVDFSLRDAWLTVDFQVVVLPTPAFEVTVTSASVTKPYIVKAPNVDGLAIWIDSSRILVTSDSFTTSRDIVIPAASASTEALVNVAFTWSNLVILTDAKLYFIQVKNHTVENSILNTDISGNPLIGVRGYDWPSEMATILGYEYVSVWTSSTVYLVTKTGNITEVSLSGQYPNTFTSPTVAIMDVAFPASGMVVGILAKLTEGAASEVHLFTKDLKYNTWEITDLTPSVTDMPNFSWRLIFRMQAQKSALVWNDDHIVGYRGNGTLDCSLLEEFSSGNTTLHETWGTLYQVAFSFSGDIIFATDNNVLLYSKMTSNTTIKLQTAEATTINMAPYYDSLNLLRLVIHNGTALSTTVYSLDNEVFSAMYPSTACEVMVFQTNIQSPTYFIDMQRKLDLWATLMRRSSDSSSIQLHLEGLGTWNENSSSYFLNYKDVVKENKSLTLYHDAEYSGVSDYAASLASTEGHINVEFSVDETFTCTPRRPAVTQVMIGCPPGRKIGIIKEEGEHCQISNTFIVKRIENGIEVNEEHVYDLNTWGCPIRIKTGHKFIPQLNLYDDEEFVERVPVDFILWEKYDQPNIEYNMTMTQARCQKTAQSWLSMQQATPTYTSLGDVWGPENYEPCFDGNPEAAADLSQPYQIFNRTNFLALEFSNEYDGIYIFKAKIVDPNYSFCDLSVEFAVQVYGTIPLEDVAFMLKAVMCFIGIFMALLALSYIRLRNILIKEQNEEDEDEAEREWSELKSELESTVLKDKASTKTSTKNLSQKRVSFQNVPKD